MMFHRIGLTAAAFAIAILTISSPRAEQYTDMRGIWSGTYLAISPSRENNPGPRFNKGELVVDIKEQSENAFWGMSKWRVVGRDAWNSSEVTGSISLIDPSAVSILEKSSNPETGVAGLIDGTLKGGKLYINFRGFRAGTAYSAVLERSHTRP